MLSLFEIFKIEFERHNRTHDYGTYVIDKFGTHRGKKSVFLIFDALNLHTSNEEQYFKKRSFYIKRVGPSVCAFITVRSFL